MTLVVAVLALVVVVLTFLVAGLLRSHGEILRRLHELDPQGTPEGSATSTASGTASGRTDEGDDLGLPRPVAQIEGRAAADVAGVTPGGDAVGIRVSGVRHDTVLVFLSSGCTTCHPFWDALRTADLPGRARLVVVTKGEDHESPVAVGELAPEGVTVVMSSESWTDYNVPGSPYLVHVDGESGRVRGEGTGADWEAVRRMLLEAAGDLDLRRSRKAAADAAREQEVDEVLLAAGIRPGDASLYPEGEA